MSEGDVRRAVADDAGRLAAVYRRAYARNEKLGFPTKAGSATADTVRGWDCGTIWLTTPSEHPFLPDRYRARGYEQSGEWPLAYRDYDEIVVEKRLDG